MPIRYKIFGQQEYAYRIWNEKISKTGQWIQHSEYLGVVVDKKTRFLKSVTQKPLYFRYVVGNIGDVSTLTTTIREIKKFGVVQTLSIVDAGYFSERNIKALYNGEV